MQLYNSVCTCLGMIQTTGIRFFHYHWCQSALRYVHRYLLHFIKLLIYSIEAQQNRKWYIIFESKPFTKQQQFHIKMCNVYICVCVCTTISAKENKNAIYILPGAVFARSHVSFIGGVTLLGPDLFWRVQLGIRHWSA